MYDRLCRSGFYAWIRGFGRSKDCLQCAAVWTETRWRATPRIWISPSLFSIRAVRKSGNSLPEWWEWKKNFESNWIFFFLLLLNWKNILFFNFNYNWLKFTEVDWTWTTWVDLKYQTFDCFVHLLNVILNVWSTELWIKGFLLPNLWVKKKELTQRLK